MAYTFKPKIEHFFALYISRMIQKHQFPQCGNAAQFDRIVLKHHPTHPTPRLQIQSYVYSGGLTDIIIFVLPFISYKTFILRVFVRGNVGWYL